MDKNMKILLLLGAAGAGFLIWRSRHQQPVAPQVMTAPAPSGPSSLISGIGTSISNAAAALTAPGAGFNAAVNKATSRSGTVFSGKRGMGSLG